jgi:hypothetical protein
MKSKFAGLLAGLVLLGAVTRAEATPITYAVSLFDGNAFTVPGGTVEMGVGGSITTDGTLGTLTASNIIDWDLIGTVLGAGGLVHSTLSLISPGHLVEITPHFL